jgi:glycosyltransferase involved in cell wall biosynthesis
VTAGAVSVVIPAWNAERFIAQAIGSVLDQTAPPGEIVVVDDGSTDATAAIAGSIGALVRVVRRPHEGPGATRNAGVAASSGRYLAFLDADDLWLPPKLERQLAVLETQPSIDAVCCHMDEFANVDDAPPGELRAPRSNVAAPLSSTTIFRRELVERIGGFPATPVADWVRWWAGARAAGIREHVIPEVLCLRRIHGANNSFRRYDGRNFLAIARDHLRAREAEA